MISVQGFWTCWQLLFHFLCPSPACISDSPWPSPSVQTETGHIWIVSVPIATSSEVMRCLVLGTGPEVRETAPETNFPPRHSDSILHIPLALRLRGLSLTRWNLTYSLSEELETHARRSINYQLVFVGTKKMYSQFEQMLVKITLEWKRRHV